MDIGVLLLWERKINLKSPLASVFPFVLLQMALSSGMASLGGFEAPKSPDTKIQADCQGVFQVPRATKDIQALSSLIFIFLMHLAFRFHLLGCFSQSESSDIVQTPVQVSIESRIFYHRLSSFRVSKDVKLFLFFPLKIFYIALQWNMHSLHSPVELADFYSLF